jgi:alanyl-tRNA synthetase
LKYVTAQVGGKGGGRADMAQGAAGDVTALPQALESVYSWVADSLG